MLRRWPCIRNPVEKVQTVLEKTHATDSVIRIHPNPDTAQHIENQRVGAARRADPRFRRDAPSLRYKGAFGTRDGRRSAPHLREAATALPEVRGPDGAAPLPIDTKGAAAPRREAPPFSMVGTARSPRRRLRAGVRRRPTPCGGLPRRSREAHRLACQDGVAKRIGWSAPAISEKRRRRRLKSGAPTARRPYPLTRRVLPHQGAKRPLF